MPLVWNNEHLHGERHLAFHYTHSPLRAAPLDPNSDVEYSEKLAKVFVRQSRGAIPPGTHLDLFGGVHEPKWAFDTLWRILSQAHRQRSLPSMFSPQEPCLL